MMRHLRLVPLALTLGLLLVACSGGKASPSPSMPAVSPSPSAGGLFGPPTMEPSPSPKAVDPAALTLEERYAPPTGYTRVETDDGSFGTYLRAIPLKPDGSAVLQHDGTASEASAAAVVDLSIGAGDRCQLTDALLLLRARYLFDAGRKDEIQFYFSSGFLYDFTTYAAGRRVKVDGNNVTWVTKDTPGDTLQDLYGYLGTLYSYSRAVSVKANDTMQTSNVVPGTLFTNDGGAIIADLARNDATGESVVLLIRGGSPASDLYVMDNTLAPELSPWFSVSPAGGIYAGEITFMISDAREFVH